MNHNLTWTYISTLPIYEQQLILSLISYDSVLSTSNSSHHPIISSIFQSQIQSHIQSHNPIISSIVQSHNTNDHTPNINNNVKLDSDDTNNKLDSKDEVDFSDIKLEGDGKMEISNKSLIEKLNIAEIDEKFDDIFGKWNDDDDNDI